MKNKLFWRLIFAIHFFLFFFNHIYRTRGTAAPITLKILLMQKVLGFNRLTYWPVHHSSIVSNPRNIIIGIGTAPGLAPGCYIQGIGKITIGDYTIIGPNVGIISANHNIYDYRKHRIGSVTIGNYCWIGMNSVILPNVILGNHTIIAAGSIVNKSFPNGFVILAGNPAKVVKEIDPALCNNFQNPYEYYGYIPEKWFNWWKKLFLNDD